MKANELMIGDFLRYKQDFPHKHLQGKLVKVCGIEGRVDVRTIDDGVFHDSVHPDWLKPIPITPEILEKNGFKKDTGEECWACKIGWFTPHKYNKKFISASWEVTICGTTANFNSFSGVIKYVHDLQHALRLCGIEKEIEL